MQAEKQDGQVITAKQEALIELLLTGVTVAAAAKQLNVNESTAHRWLKIPLVKAAYRQARQDMFDDRLSLLRDGVNIPIKTLMQLMTGAKSEFVRCQAASKWLDTSIEVFKMNDLEARLHDLEERLKAS